MLCFRRDLRRDFGNYLSSSIIHMSSSKTTELRHQTHPHQLHEYPSLSVNSETHLAISPLMPLIKMQLMGKPWPSPFSLMHHRLCILYITGRLYVFLFFFLKVVFVCFPSFVCMYALCVWF